MSRLMRSLYVLTLASLIVASGCKKDSPSGVPSNSNNNSSASASSTTNNNDTIHLNIAQWGWVAKCEKQIEEYALSKGMKLDVHFPKPYILEHADVFEYMRSERADMFVAQCDLLKAHKGKLFNVIMPIDISKIPNYQKIDPRIRERSKYRDMFIRDGQYYGCPYRADIQTLIYNSYRVKAPTSYDVLFKPESKNKFCVLNAQNETNVRPALTVLGYPETTFYNMDSEPVAWDKVENLVDVLVQNMYMACDFDQTDVLRIAPSEVSDDCLYFYAVCSVLDPIIKKDKHKWKAAVLDHGCELFIEVFCLGSHIKNNPDKIKAAYLVIDYMLSDEMQKVVYDVQHYVPVTVDARRQLAKEVKDDARLSENFYDNEKFLPYSRQIRTTNYYNMLWDAAMKKAGRAGSSVEAKPTTCTHPS